MNNLLLLVNRVLTAGTSVGPFTANGYRYKTIKLSSHRFEIEKPRKIEG